MKAATPIGIVVALGGIALGAIMEGTNLAAVINIPAFLIVFGGTAGACIAASGMSAFLLFPKLYIKAFKGEQPDFAGRVQTLVAHADKARKDGLLALEEEVEQIDDEFVKKGLQLVVDGTDPDLVCEIMEAEIGAMKKRHKAGAGVFEKAAGFAPTMGVLGTVMGLVHVLENLDKPETLGPAISGAFIATLFGVGAANVIFFPVANRLSGLSAAEAEEREIVLEGVLAIQAGENPRVVQEKLLSFIAPADRETVTAADAKPKLEAVEGGAAQAA